MGVIGYGVSGLMWSGVKDQGQTSYFEFTYAHFILEVQQKLFLIKWSTMAWRRKRCDRTSQPVSSEIEVRIVKCAVIKST